MAIMFQAQKLNTPVSEADVRSLKAGDEVKICGVIYTARDMAHKRLCQAVELGRELPFELEGAVIYFCGPTPGVPGSVIGAAGPTTSSRMDVFSPVLIENGLKAMIGKGYRNNQVRESLRKHKAVHFSATGGAGALLSKHIKSARIIAYEQLGTEAIRRLEVVDFPVIVAYDSSGDTIYKEL